MVIPHPGGGKSAGVMNFMAWDEPGGASRRVKITRARNNELGTGSFFLEGLFAQPEDERKRKNRFKNMASSFFPL
jgi:hypothetical protein